jgi:hypothetical protein
MNRFLQILLLFSLVLGFAEYKCVPNNLVSNLYDAMQNTSSMKAIARINTQVKGLG